MADDPHAEATPIELISQNEALQRERSGGFLANGQRAPAVAAVDMQSPPPGGGTAPKQPAAQSQPTARGPASSKVSPEDDDYYSEKGVAVSSGKGKKSVEEDDYFGAPEAKVPPAPAKGAATGPSFLDKAMTRIGAGEERLGAGVQEAYGSSVYDDARKKYWQALILPDAVRQAKKDNVTLTEDPLVMQTAKHLKIRPDVFARDWPDFVNMPDADRQKFMDEQSKEIARGGDLLSSGMQRRQTAGAIEKNFAPDTEGAPVQNFALNLASVAPDLVGGLGMAMVPAGQIPAAALLTTDFGLRGYSHGRDAGLSDGDAKVYGALTGAANLVPEMPVISALGKAPGASAVLETAFGKTIANSAAGKVGGMAINQGVAGATQTALQMAVDKGMLNQDMSLSDALGELANGFLTGTVIGATTGAVHAGTNRLVNGPAKDSLGSVVDQTGLTGVPHQAVERPSNIMEYAQIVAAQAEAARGGDTLDQVGAAIHANATLSAHHDAAAYEAHMETQHLRVTEENAVADQQAEQQAREDALNMAANEKAAPVTPTTLFERREQEQAAQKDKDFTAAKNQKGDQDIARGETLEAGAEKGGEGFEKPKLLDTLSPEQAEAFKTLKERRAAEDTKSDTKSISDRLKEQNPEDNFTPYVEPKSAKEDIAEKPAEGDTWKAPTGATVEVLKDHNDGTYTVRTTPADSSQSPRRRRVSEAALDLMRSTAEPPENLSERRANIGGNPDVGLADHDIQVHADADRAAAARVDEEAHQAATSPKNDEPIPTEAQQNAGNFKMGHIEVQGLPITVEHLEGSTRPNGVEQPAHYGYVKGTMGADGMHVDVLVGKHPESDTHFIVDHMNDQGFEQHKVLTGFANRLEAMRAYRKAFPDNPMGPVSEVKTPELKEWLNKGDTTKPFDPKGVNRLADTRSRFVENNASGESPASLEAIRRQAEEKAKGQTRHLVDPDGNATPLTGVDAVDAKAPPGHIIAQADGKGGHTVLDRGGLPAMHANGLLARAKAKGALDAEQVRARDEPIKGEAPHSPDASDTDRRLKPRMTPEEAKAALKPLTDVVGGDGLQIHTNKATLPDHIQEQMVTGNHRNPRGVYDPTTGIVHIVADAHSSNDEIMRTGVHETVAHKGLRAIFKKAADFRAVMQDIYDNIHKSASAIGSPLKGVNKTSARNWFKDYASQHGLDLRNPSHQRLVSEEYAAHLAEHDVNDPRQQNPSILRRVYDAVRAELRKVGVVREWTDNDIRALLRKAKSSLVDENAGARESAQAKGDGPRFADEENHDVERLAPDHPLAQAHKYGLTKEAQANYNPGFVRSRLDASEQAGVNGIDHFLGLISLHNLPDSIDGKIMPAPRAFSDMTQRMDGRRGKLAEEAVKPLRDWETWANKNKDTDEELRKIMGASTLGGVDPSKPFESSYTAESKAANPTQQAHENMQRDLHRQLKDTYDNRLDDKGREIYNTIRDHYTKMRDTAQAAFQQRIRESGGTDAAKARLLDTLRAEFESGRVKGPYFPLARFGDRWAVAKNPDGSTFSYSRFETKAEQRAWLAQRKAEGFKDEQLAGGQKADTSSTIAKIDPNFVAKITDMVKDIDPGLADEIWQEYLKQLPEMSMRKNFIHRQGVLGFSSDQLRAFAYNSFHNAHQTARLEYTHKLDGIMDDMDAQRRAIDQKNPASSDSDWANAMMREFGKRYDWIKNPRGHPLAASLTKFGSAWYLSWSPATAFRIFSQQGMIALPTLGGQHGYGRATKELARAMTQWATTRGPLGDKLRGDERRGFDEASNRGVFSQSYTQMLAQGGTGKPMYTGKLYHYTKAAQFLFNSMEHLNRETTYLASYRLGRAEGMDHDTAVSHGVKMSRLSHFDYSNANRPRILQSNSAKVIGLFKSYSAGVTYRLAREFREMTTLQTQDPGERMKAFKTFSGLMAGTMMFAGVTGVPFSWLAFYAMNKVFGDKDQPFDSKAAFHQWLSDHMGHTAADAIVTGPVGAMSHANLSTGASYSDLWYKPPARDMKPNEQWSDLLNQAVGAVPAIATNAVTGLSMMGDDHIERGLEHMVPPFAAGPMKAWRYAHEGVTNLQGEQIISKDELTGWEIALQAADFTPQKVRDAQEWHSARTNIEKEIMDRKTLLLNRFDTAVKNGDSDALTKASEALARFAQVNPGVARDLGKTEVSSVMSKAKKSATSVAGTNLNPGLRNLDSIYGSSPFPPEEK